MYGICQWQSFQSFQALLSKKPSVLCIFMCCPKTPVKIFIIATMIALTAGHWWVRKTFLMSCCSWIIDKAISKTLLLLFLFKLYSHWPNSYISCKRHKTMKSIYMKSLLFHLSSGPVLSWTQAFNECFFIISTLKFKAEGRPLFCFILCWDFLSNSVDQIVVWFKLSLYIYRLLWPATFDPNGKPSIENQSILSWSSCWLWYWGVVSRRAVRNSHTSASPHLGGAILGNGWLFAQQNPYMCIFCPILGQWVPVHVALKATVHQ